ncbi:MAG: alkaline phosphatase [Actinomycetota bacterium]
MKTASIIVALALAMVIFLAALAVTMPLEETQAMGGRCSKVKNIIVMISDGCGYNQIEATDYYEAGRKKAQAYEHFPVRVGMSTYEYEGPAGGPYSLPGYDSELAWNDFNYVKGNSTDSASAATAMSTGTKTYNGAIGVDINGVQLEHTAQRAEELGMATGVITSVEWSHATPAGFVAHNASRNNYAAIGQEMIVSSATDVIMGCGHPWFDDNGQPKVSPNDYRYVGGQAVWDALVAGTAGCGIDADHNGKMDDAWKLIQTRAEFQALMKGRAPKRVCGVAQAYTTLQQARGGDGKAAPYAVPLNQSVPTLVEMTRGALNILDNDKDGFFLMIEGGAVDWAGHANQTGRLIEEEIDFNNSVEAVMEWVRCNSNWGETLLIVTGDHETGYLCGPGSAAAQHMQPVVNNGASNVPGVEWNSGDHTNALIPFYAKGMASHLFRCYADEYDRVRGCYIDNTEIARMISGLLR